MIPRHLAPRHLAARPLVFAAATLAAATLLVTTLSSAQAPAPTRAVSLEASAHRPSADHPVSAVRAALEGAVMCVVEPVNPPPCGTPKAGAR